MSKISPSGSVGQKAARSGIWAILINILDKILQLAKLIILTNILPPEDFGLIGISLLALAFIKRFSVLGLDTAIIQRVESNVDPYLNTAWSIKIIRGATIGLLLYILAPLIAEFFGEPRAVPIIKVISLSPVILSLQNPGIIYLRKNLEFHKQAIYTLSSTFVSVVIAITWAIIYQNVWALVFGLIAGELTKLITSYIIHIYRPRPEFNRKYASELIGYGKWITVSGIILILLTQGDDAFVGWFLAASSLGIYQIAYRFSNAPATEISEVISRVALPTYSSLQENKSKVRIVYLTVLELTAAISVLIAIGIFTLAPLFVSEFLGNNWTEAILPMQILSIFGLIRAVGSVDGPLLKAVGRPELATKYHAIQLIILSILLYPLTSYHGITGTSIAVLVSLFVSVVLKSHTAIQFLELHYVKYIKALGFPLVGGVIMAAVIYITQVYIIGFSSKIVVIPFILVGTCSYVLSLLVMEYIFSYNITNSVNRLYGFAK